VPLESPPEAGAIWFNNWALDASIAGKSTERALYPATNLLSPHRSETWRSTNATADQYVIFDLGSAKLPTCFALTDVNFDAGATVLLYASDDSAGLVNAVRWDFPLYPQDDVSKVLRWYLGTPTGGTAGVRRFWWVFLSPGFFGPYGTDEDLFEIGSVFLGDYTAITPNQGVRISPNDPSDRQRAYGRAQWSDPIRPYHEIDLTVADMTFAEFYTLKRKVAAQGSKHAILDVHAYSTDPIVKGGGCFYGYFSDSQTGTLEAPELNDLRISFEEASG